MAHITSQGYYKIGAQVEHVRVAEAVLGRVLPTGACVHHVDHDRTNNARSNLVICPSQAYHSLLHRRERALDACGHADWLKCAYCGKYDDPANLYVKPQTWFHAECGRRYCAERVLRNRKPLRFCECGAQLGPTNRSGYCRAHYNQARK